MPLPVANPPLALQLRVGEVAHTLLGLVAVDRVVRSAAAAKKKRPKNINTEEKRSPR